MVSKINEKNKMKRQYSDDRKILYSWRDCRRAYIYGFVFGLSAGLIAWFANDILLSEEKTGAGRPEIRLKTLDRTDKKEDTLEYLSTNYASIVNKQDGGLIIK